MGEIITKILGLGKLGIALAIISIILIVVGYYNITFIEDFFETEILLEDKSNVNIFIRLYGGFLASSALILTAQLILWVLQKTVYAGLGETDWADDIKTVRNFSVYALILLTALLSFVAGKSFVRI